MINSLVSILIPVYNRQDLIRKSVISASNQTYENIEIIVVDNCSTDNTWDELIKLRDDIKELKIFRNNNNLGPVVNWQKCLEYSSGEYITILWSDDILEKNCIKRLVCKMEPDICFVVPGILNINEEGKIISKSNYQSIGKLPIETYLQDIIIYSNFMFPKSPCGTLFRKSDVVKGLLIDVPNTQNLNFNRYGAGNDLLIFLLTTQNINYKHVGFIDDYLVSYLTHSKSISIEFRKEILMYYDWAIAYFLNIQNNINLRSKFKSLLFYRSIIHYHSFSIFNSIKGRINTLHFIYIIYMRTKSIILKS